MPTPSEPEAQEPDSGPLKKLSLAVLLALAVEIGLLVLLGRAAL
jgi:hypothetical protein